MEFFMCKLTTYVCVTKCVLCMALTTYSTESSLTFFYFTKLTYHHGFARPLYKRLKRYDQFCIIVIAVCLFYLVSIFPPPLGREEPAFDKLSMA